MTQVHWSIGILDLAKFVHRKGDIHFHRDRSTTPEEGLKTQRILQQGKGDGYQTEVKLEYQYVLPDLVLTLNGRIDGLDLKHRTLPEQTDSGIVGQVALRQPAQQVTCTESIPGAKPDSTPEIEEYKASRTDPEQLHTHRGHLHWAQLKLYAAIMARLNPEVDTWCVRLIYAHPDSLWCRNWERHLSAVELEDFLARTCDSFRAILMRHRSYLRQRNESLQHLTFPFRSFRTQQKELAQVCYRSFRESEQILLEAPTGSGKTLATLFPALKALAYEAPDRILFLSSRTTGQQAAEDACKHLLQHQVQLSADRASADSARARLPSSGFRCITIRAKEKICPVPGTPCDSKLCGYARGYYDRAPQAIAACLAVDQLLTDTISDIAREYHVCPFELTLDCAIWCDVVIGDINYVFDPVVRLQRVSGVFGEPTVLLVDEAHQLAPRVREMLSADFDRTRLLSVLRRCQNSLPATLIARMRSLDRQLLKMRRDARAAFGSDTTSESQNCTTGRIKLPEALVRSMQRLLQALEDVDLQMSDPEFTQLVFAVFRFCRAAEWYHEERFCVLFRSSGRQIAVRIFCVDPAQHISDTLKAFDSGVRFSATLSPPDLYRRAQGCLATRAWRLQSPFQGSQLAISLVTDIDTRYRRREDTLDRLVDLIHRFRKPRPGKYMVAFPSFAYLNRVAEAYRLTYPHEGLVCQERAMQTQEQEAFLRHFLGESRTPQLGFVVLGGRFTESVDYPGDSLIGMLIVSISLPPRQLETQAIEDHFGARLGFQLAYQQPGMTRVVQAAGRVIRHQNDRGVLVLVDDRFDLPEYRAFLPEHWHPVCCLASEVENRNNQFWCEQSVLSQ